MKASPLFAIATLLSLACTDSRAIDVNTAPDLKPEIAKTLAPVGKTWFGNGRHPSKPADVWTPPHARRQCWATYYYTAQITYPRTYCVPPPELDTVLNAKEAATIGPLGTNKDGTLSFSRLIRMGVGKQWEMFGCVTRAGPWLAEIAKYDNCDGTTEWFLGPFNAFEPRMPGSGWTFPAIEYDGSTLPPNYGLITGPTPWSTPFRGGRCSSTQLTVCPGETVGQTPGTEPPRPIIY